MALSPLVTRSGTCPTVWPANWWASTRWTMTAGRFTLGRSSSACWTCETPRRVARATLGYSSGLTARSHRAAPAADPSGGACGPTTDRADGWTHDSPGSVQPALERHRRSWGILGGRGFGDRPRRTPIRRTVAWPGAGSRNDRHANITTGALTGSAGSRLTLQEKKGGTQSALGPQNRITP